MSALVASRSTSFINFETGQLTPDFQAKFSTIGVKFKKISDIEYINETLKENFGELANYRITGDQAISFLTQEYKKRVYIYPKESIIEHGIISYSPENGVSFEGTMFRKFHSLSESICKYQFRWVHFIVESSGDKEKVEKLLLDEENQKIFKNIKISIIVNADRASFESVFKKIIETETSPKQHNFALIADSPFTDKISLVAKNGFYGYRFAGITFAPIINWHRDMTLCNFTQQSYVTDEKATIAWANSILWSISREFNTQTQFWKEQQLALMIKNQMGEFEQSITSPELKMKRRFAVVRISIFFIGLAALGGRIFGSMIKSKE